MVAVVQLGKMAGVIGKVDYAALEGLPKSFAYEAGERALAGEVSAMSKDGRYEVATFAGGWSDQPRLDSGSIAAGQSSPESTGAV